MSVNSVRAEHSGAGIASFIFSLLPFLDYAMVLPSVLLYLSNLPPEADAVPIAFGLFVIFLLSVFLETVALGLGVIGILQRHHKKTFAFLGLMCSSLALLALAFYFFV